MYAVEFEANIENGLVFIPKTYTDLIQAGKARFVAMFENPQVSIPKTNDIDLIFDNFKLDLSNYKFSRDEANER